MNGQSRILNIQEIKDLIGFPKGSIAHTSLTGLIDAWYAKDIKEGVAEETALQNTLDKYVAKINELAKPILDPQNRHTAKRVSIVTCLVPSWHFVNVAIEKHMQKFDKLTNIPEGMQSTDDAIKISGIQQVVKGLKWKLKNELNYLFN